MLKTFKQWRLEKTTLTAFRICGGKKPCFSGGGGGGSERNVRGTFLVTKSICESSLTVTKIAFNYDFPQTDQKLPWTA